jgi:transposase-like protein
MRNRDAYDQFDATELFCPTCKRANPVRKHLLIVLPDGNKYDYRCAVCGTSVGSKMDDDTSAFSLLLPS